MENQKQFEDGLLIQAKLLTSFFMWKELQRGLDWCKTKLDENNK
jgi:hypothetical protein